MKESPQEDGLRGLHEAVSQLRLKMFYSFVKVFEEVTVKESVTGGDLILE